MEKFKSKFKEKYPNCEIIDFINMQSPIRFKDENGTNYRDPIRNEKEFFDFVNWYAQVLVKNRIYIPGNHDSWIATFERQAKREFEDRGIIYLNKKEITIDGIKLYGDGISPTFGNWVFMADRSKMHKHWDLIPEDVNVLLTHTPPKGILDLSENRNGGIEMCGCSALFKKVRKLDNIKLHAFGHIHNGHGIINTGIRIMDDVIYSNATAVTDGKFEDGITFNGNLIQI